jgi:hypothetical protein
LHPRVADKKLKDEAVSGTGIPASLMPTSLTLQFLQLLPPTVNTLPGRAKGVFATTPCWRAFASMERLLLLYG